MAIVSRQTSDPLSEEISQDVLAVMNATAIERE